MNYPGHPPSHRVYMLHDPRDSRIVYVGSGSGESPWTTPRCEVGTDVSAWLVELQRVNLDPYVSLAGLPTTSLPKEAAEWIKAAKRSELIAAGLTVLRGHEPAAWRG